MSKKKIAAGFFVILTAILSNILIAFYEMPTRNLEINVNVTMSSDTENGIQLFYLQNQSKLKDGFTENLSRTVNYKKVNQTQILSYRIPADVSYIRLDFGAGQSDNNVKMIEIEYQGTAIDITGDRLLRIEDYNDVSITQKEKSLLICANNEDPYVIWSTNGWNIAQMTSAVSHNKSVVPKIILAVVIDMMLLMVLIHAKRLMVIPRELWNNRKLISRLARNDFKTKFAGSYLGIIWAFIQPIVTILVYWFVFEKGLKAGGMNTKAGIQVPYVLWLVAGLVPWLFFSDALNGGTNALTEYAYLVKKVVFKISILPIVKVISAMFVHLFFIAFTLFLYVVYGINPGIYAIQLIYYSFATFLFVLGLSYLTSALVVFFRDLTQIINIILQVGVWVTPIMWNIDTMDLNPILLSIFKLNPLYYIVAGYRDTLINHIWFWESPGLTIYFWVVTLVVLGVGVTIFKRLKIHFADVL